MNTKVMNLIVKHKIVAICRNIPLDKLRPTVQAAYDGGIRLLEITFNQSDFNSISTVVHSIEKIRNDFDNSICIGAGTVMTLEQLNYAYEAGAEFILAPNTNKTIISATVSKGLLSIPGAYTPTEISDAYSFGADIVKIFPAINLGTKYIKNIREPINHIPLMAVGGINAENMSSFFQVGCISMGIGRNIFDPKAVNNNNFSDITTRAKIYSQIASDSFMEEGNA